MKADKALQEKGEPFYTRIDAQLVDVEVALEAQQWEKAQQAVRAAETLWIRWRRGRPDWLVQLEYYDKLNEKLANLGESVFYVGEIKEAALNEHREMPNLEEPNLFRARLEPLTRQVNAFITLNERLTALTTSGTRQGRAAAKAPTTSIRALPADSAISRLQSEVEVAIQKIQIAQIDEKVAQLAKLSTTLPEAQAQPWRMPESRRV